MTHITPSPSYSAAEDRIDDTPELQPYRQIILADWPEGSEHYEWATTAPVTEIVSWAQAAAPAFEAESD